MFRSELTAISTKNSRSAAMVAEKFKEGMTMLDYGCGTGRNLKFIRENISCDAILAGCEIREQLAYNREKHDEIRNMGINIFDTENIKGEYDIVLCSHVLNVISDDTVKISVLKNIEKHLKKNGKAVIEVRTKSDVEKSKTKVKFGDGFQIKKGKYYTYQEGISAEKMVRLVSSTSLEIEEHMCNSKHIIILKK